MTIKTELRENTPAEPVTEYPCIGMSEHTGLIVLFTGEKVGTVLKEAFSSHPVGWYSETWQMHRFDILPAGSTITLTVE